MLQSYLCTSAHLPLLHPRRTGDARALLLGLSALSCELGRRCPAHECVLDLEQVAPQALDELPDRLALVGDCRDKRVAGDASRRAHRLHAFLSALAHARGGAG